MWTEWNDLIPCKSTWKKKLELKELSTKKNIKQNEKNYSSTLTNMDLNCAGPLTSEFFTVQDYKCIFS